MRSASVALAYIAIHYDLIAHVRLKHTAQPTHTDACRALRITYFLVDITLCFLSYLFYFLQQPLALRRDAL